MEPLDVLHALLEIERSISRASHRKADGSYADRLIDIDLIAIDHLRVESPELTLPHPRAHLRPFVTIPLADLSTDPNLLS